MIYSTERLVVREWTDQPDDVAHLYDLYSRWEVARWLCARPQAMSDPAQAERVVARWRAGYAADPRCGIEVEAFVRRQGQ